MVSVVQTPDRFPHRCISCNVGVEGTDREFWVDFGDSEAEPGDGPYMRTSYVCSACLTAIAVEVGFTTPKDTLALEHKIADLSEMLFDAKVKADGLEQGLEGLLRARFVSDSTDSIADHVVSNPVNGGESQQDEGGSLPSGEGTTAESSSVEGLADVHPAPGVDASKWTF